MKFRTIAAIAALAAMSAAPAFAADKTVAASMMSGSMGGSMGPHGMPAGNAGADGTPYTGKPDLATAVSLVTAGGPVGSFSITTAIAALSSPAIAKAEVAKLTKQYGASKVGSFVTVQNFAVDDAVKVATAAGVKFPAPNLKGKALAVKVTTYGVNDGAYYEGVMLDHLVSHPIHEKVMQDIDAKYGKTADANYHRIADQAHYDLAQALGAKSVGLASYH